jgi:hypothetical protein
VRGDVPVDNEALLVTDFMNLKIKPIQSFGCAHRDSVCLRVFIEVSANMCMSICVCTVEVSHQERIAVDGDVASH